MSSRGETFVTEDVRDAILDKYPGYDKVDFCLKPTTLVDAWCDEQLPGSLTVEMTDAETEDLLARFDVKVKFAIERDTHTRYVVVSKILVRRVFAAKATKSKTGARAA